MKKKMILITSLILLSVCAALIILAVFLKKNAFDPTAEEITVDLDGVDSPVKILWISDLHIAVKSKNSMGKYSDDLLARVKWTQNSAGKWKNNWPDLINNSGADLVVFGGDMLDFGSLNNASVFRDGLNKLKIPYIYLRCDHDVMPTYISQLEADEAAKIRDGLCDNSDIITYEFEDFTVAGWNNSSFNITDDGLKKMQDICSNGKPVLLMTHVPLEPKQDTSLSEASRDIFQGRSLLWGYNDQYYWPEYNTRQFLDIIYADDSPVKEVFCGHLHFSWDGYLTDSVKQHVFAAAFEENYGIITVK
ncbi:MAG: metallophosphoesterase [Lachnospiraceae bacterium]|nr:metallophosphoesterase [Lachnospiraceae bacterium]